MIKFQNIYISSIESYLPENSVTNNEIINKNNLKIKSSWIEKNIGITCRRWASADEAASDLATKAILKMQTNELDGALWVSTISPDYLTPSTSSIIKKKANLTTKAPAFDISAACSGWIFALENAAIRLTATDEKEALVIATEVRSKFLNLLDRRTVFLFGDGAVSAKILKQRPANSFFKLNWTYTSTIPSPIIEILVPAGGSVSPINQENLSKGEQYINMVDGNSIVAATHSHLIDSIKSILKDQTLNDYDLVLFHQGNKQLILSILKELKLDESKTHITFDKYGNSSSASIGITLKDALIENKIKDNSKILMITFGAGQHLGLAELIWNR